MQSLPVAVTDEDIADMFAVADSDRDGRISYHEFQVYGGSSDQLTPVPEDDQPTQAAGREETDQGRPGAEILTGGGGTWCTWSTWGTRCRGMFGVHNIFVKPD